MNSFDRLRQNGEDHIREDKWEQRKGVFTEPPERTPCDTFVDAPLMGNGDVGVAIGGDASEQTFHIGKNDFWRQAHLGETWEQRLDRLLNDHGRRTGTAITTVGQIILHIPQLKGASYYQEQDILNAEVRGSFSKDLMTVKMCSWVYAISNLLVTEVSYIAEVDEENTGTQNGELEITIEQHAGEKDAYEVYNYETGKDDTLFWFKYSANSTNVPDNRRVGVVTKIFGKEFKIQDSFQTCAAVLKIKQGEKIFITTAINSNLDNENYLEFSQNAVRMLFLDKFHELKEKHREWWRSFWKESYVEIGDPMLEKYYYGSNYILASCIRSGKVPPGLFGNWVTTEHPTWTGSYTLNYNYESPYWGLYAGNHIGITGSYCEPPLAAIPLGKVFAKELLGCRGIYFPVEMGPWGTFCSMMFHDQKINAVYVTVNLLMHFYHTYDTDYAQKIYPYLQEVSEFWEDYLVFEDGYYIIYDDSIHERSKDHKNPIHSMGMVQMVFKGILDISRELNINSERYEKWLHIVEHFSPYPVFEKNGKTIFRFTEEGMEYREDNTVGTQHIYPAGMIGFESDTELLQTAWNTVHEMQRWSDFNAFPTYYTTAARVGYFPEVILEKLREECCAKGYPNLSIHHGGGGIEDCNGVTSCIQEMLLQSYEGVIRLFPVWPKNKDVRFGMLRVVGAFLVSSEYKNSIVSYVCIESEKGRDCTMQNPWQGKRIALYGDCGRVEKLDGLRVTFKTGVNEQIILIPEEMSLNEVKI